jgi:hypothetical protein
MYEQFSIDSKLLKPNISILKNYEDKNSRINSFSIKGSMIENPVGDIDIVDKKHLIQNKGRDTSSNNTLRFNQNFSGSSFSQNEEMQNKMNLSHIKISSTSINQSIINNTNFNSKSNLAISPSPSTTNDTNKIILNNQVPSSLYSIIRIIKKGCFHIPK